MSNSLAGDKLVLQVALNGDSQHPAMPRTEKQIARDAKECVAAGATLLHLHAFDDDGKETLAEHAVARTIKAVRATCPGIPISMTTFAQIEPDPRRRLAALEQWSVLPDLVPANQGEAGVIELTQLFLSRGIEVEACVFTIADVENLLQRGQTDLFRRVVVEPMEADPVAACKHAVAMERALLDGGVGLEQLHHGMGEASWPVLRQAIARGWGIRTGIEDTSRLDDGTFAPDNLSLVRAAVALTRAK